MISTSCCVMGKWLLGYSGLEDNGKKNNYVKEKWKIYIIER